MEIFQKAKILSESGKYDSCGPKACEVNISQGIGGIYNAKAEHKTCRLFKTLMTNSCSFDCKYCPNSTSARSKTKKVEYKPEEIARLFSYMTKKLVVHGLFLSSAVASSPDSATEKMLSAVRLIRFKYNFKGYIHFKILPGVSYELIKQACELSDRMSINIESPNKSGLSEMSTNKDYKIDILKRQAWISRLSKNQTTQMMITNFSNDKEILAMMKWEYEKIKINRMYFSAFKPIKGTQMENEKAQKDSRQNHLYNIDFLIRKYNYSFNEIRNVLVDDMLKDEDPKLAIAKANFIGPIDIRDATYEELIRVPGIGPLTAKKILNRKISSYQELYKFGPQTKKAIPFLKIAGKTQKMLSDF